MTPHLLLKSIIADTSVRFLCPLHKRADLMIIASYLTVVVLLPQSLYIHVRPAANTWRSMFPKLHCTGCRCLWLWCRIVAATVAVSCMQNLVETELDPQCFI